MKLLTKNTLLLFITMLFIYCDKQHKYDELIIYSGESGAFSFTKKCFILDFREKTVFYTRTIPNGRPGKEMQDSLIIKKTSLNNNTINTIKQKIETIKLNEITKKEMRLSEEKYYYLMTIKDNLTLWQIDHPTYNMPSEFYEILNIMNKLSFKEQFNNPLLNAIKIDKMNPVAFDPLNNKHGIPIYSIKFTAFISYLSKADVVKNNTNLKGQFIYVLSNAITPTYVPTDGRYYAFPIETGDTLTLDIGFNFLETIMKEEYDKWKNENNSQ